MAVTKVKGDLLKLAREGHFDIVVHGANCQSTMNSGIAKQIKDQFPEAYYADVDDRRKPEHKLGCYSNAYIEQYKFIIVNAYTQLNYNRKGEEFKDHFEYEAFEKILRTLAKYHPNNRYGLPYIGMGLAGGNKERILTMLEDFSNQITGTVTLVEYEN
jgi:O-acetyl-ADP-ribose deacetylase (regulator of RNase III)